MVRTALRAITISILGLVLWMSSTPAHAQPVGTGNLIIYRVGDGGAALTNAATAVFLDEYTQAGVFVRSIPITTTGASAMTAVGNATTEGIMTLAQDGSRLIYTGYRKDAGGTNPSADAPATTNRVIGTLLPTGVFTTNVALTDPTGTIRSATSVSGNGTDPFYTSTSIQVGYVATPGTPTTVQIDARNSRQVSLSGNTLFASNGSTSITGKVQTYGTLPTGATAATPIVSLLTTDAVNGFFLCDLNAAIPGNDTLYANSTVESLIRRYNFDGTNWVAAGSISSAAANITGSVSGTTATLFFTSASSLFSFTDASGATGTLSGTVGAAIATAGANTAFRGVGMFTSTPVPEPSSFALMGLGAIGLAARWRKRRKAVA